MGFKSPNPNGLKAFTLLLALLWGLNGIFAHAESLYQTSPKLSHRNRMTAPVVSPLLPVKEYAKISPAQPEQAAQHPKAEPIVPVSFQPPQKKTPAGPAPVKPIEVKPPKPKQVKAAPPVVTLSPSTTPETAKSKPEKAPRPKRPAKTASESRQQAKSKLHPVVVAPEPLLPAPKTTATTAQPGMQPVAHYPKAASHQPEADIKSLEHHPQHAQAQRRHIHDQQQTEWEPGFYPIGYHPYVPPVMALKAREHQNALAHYHRAGYYGQTSQIDLAIREYQEAIRQNPMLADAYVGLSSAYLFKNNWEDSILKANQALAMKAGFVDPANVTQARYNLSTAYCAADDFGKAKRFYKQVKAANHPRADALWRYIQTNCKP